eukprot:533883_1
MGSALRKFRTINIQYLDISQINIVIITNIINNIIRWNIKYLIIYLIIYINNVSNWFKSDSSFGYNCCINWFRCNCRYNWCINWFRTSNWYKWIIITICTINKIFKWIIKKTKWLFNNIIRCIKCMCWWRIIINEKILLQSQISYLEPPRPQTYSINTSSIHSLESGPFNKHLKYIKDASIQINSLSNRTYPSSESLTETLFTDVYTFDIYYTCIEINAPIYDPSSAHYTATADPISTPKPKPIGYIFNGENNEIFYENNNENNTPISDVLERENNKIIYGYNNRNNSPIGHIFNGLNGGRITAFKQPPNDKNNIIFNG